MNFLKMRTKKRLLVLFFIFMAINIVLASRLFYLQIFPDERVLSGQLDQLMGQIPIVAPRGEIYDRNMVLLVKDATSYRIYAHPNDIEDYEATARVLSEKLGLDYESTLKKISNKSSALELMKTKVDADLANEIREETGLGISVEEDQKRYYTNGNFMSNVLGFTGYDHQGLFGIEEAYDDILSGTNGVLIYEKDANGNKIVSGSEIRKEAEAGNSILLTMDGIIQHFAETEVAAVLKETNARRALAIVSDINTGEILAMVVKPDYDLNDPWTVSQEFIDSYGDYLYKKDESGNSVRMSEGEMQMVMWGNPAINFNYEPGSTFKLITTSATLEEGVMNMQTSFYCPGYIVVDGVRIRCTATHGSQELHTAVANSCNPALVQIVQALGRDSFYEYAYNFGLGETTGIALSGEEGGIVPPNDENMYNIDFATKAFGQGISVTPIQLTMALNAVSNGGYLYTPHVVKEVIDSETGENVHTYEPELLRQVISSETSDKMLSIMREMVQESSLEGLSNGLEIAGKTGTSQKVIDGKYSDTVHIASFYGVAPYDDPQVSVLVLVDEPEGAYYGSQVAAPAGIAILQKVINYYDLHSTANASVSKVVPDLRGEDIDNAVNALQTLGLTYHIEGDSTGIVTKQSPVNIEYKDASSLTINLTVSAVAGEGGQVVVPDLTNMSVQKANEVLTNLGLKIKIKGGGIVKSQSPATGQLIDANTEVTVECEYAP